MVHQQKCKKKKKSYNHSTPEWLTVEDSSQEGREKQTCSLNVLVWVMLWGETEVNDNKSPRAACLSSACPRVSHLTPICCSGAALFEHAGVYGQLWDANCAGTGSASHNNVYTVEPWKTHTLFSLFELLPPRFHLHLFSHSWDRCFSSLLQVWGWWLSSAGLVKWVCYVCPTYNMFFLKPIIFLLPFFFYPYIILLLFVCCTAFCGFVADSWLFCSFRYALGLYKYCI